MHSESPITRRRALAATASAGSVVVAGCSAIGDPSCSTALKERSTEGNLLASASVDMDGGKEGSITIEWWDSVGTDSNPANLVVVYGEDGAQSTKLRPKSGDSLSSTKTTFDSKNQILTIQILDVDGAVLETHRLEVNCV